MALDAVAEAVAWRHASAKDVGMDEALQARQEEATTARMEAKSETAAERRRRFMRRPKHGAWLRATTWASLRKMWSQIAQARFTLCGATKPKSTHAVEYIYLYLLTIFSTGS